jgi:Bacterial Ig-like domain
MRSHYFKFINIFLIVLIVVSCARRGRPTGGPKDEDSPIMVTAEPPFETTNFDKKKIKILFDEYIKLKNVGKQLIISPPLKYKPIVSPLGTASKILEIEILDTLKPETTYIFNFGTSVQDNNEGNILYNFKYVFSTGDYIDSLSLKGTIRDALSNDVDKEVSILLYKIDSTYNDSLIYKGLPNYIANTLDTVTWNITNIKKGKYLLAALKQKNYDYKFKPKTDKIAFYPELIDIPVDSSASFELSLFKEILDYRITRPSEVSKQHIVFGYEGIVKDLKVDLLSKVPDDFKSVEAFEADKDTLNYWFNTADLDSLQFKITNYLRDTTYVDTVVVKLRAKEFDSLIVGGNKRGSIKLKENFKMLSNQPITKIDTSKIQIVDKDSVKIPFKAIISDFKTELLLKFDKIPSNYYKIKMLPQAITTFFEQSKDTFRYRVSTKRITDYGSIFLTLKGVKSYPLIIELVNSRGKVVQSQYVEKLRELSFRSLNPSKYFIRAIYDNNKNKKWDTGNFLERIQPEKVIYFPKQMDVRANWEVSEIFDLSKE